MTADTLRSRVVLLVLGLVGLLAIGLYGFIGYLLATAPGPLTDRSAAVPDALWLAAGTYGGALVTWLVNSKGTDAQQVQVVNQPDQPVPVEAAPEAP